MSPAVIMAIRNLAILSVLFFSFGTMSGQTSSEDVHALVKKYVRGLNAKGIDTVCIYEDFCIGCLYMWKKDEDKCNFKGLFIPTYIFWSDKGQSFMTRKDNCFDYSTVKIENDSLWHFFFTNRATIEKENIKMPQYVVVENGKENVYVSSIDHSTHQGIQILLREDTLINKDLDEYYFSKEIGHEGKININYDYNVNSRLKNFQLLIARTIDTAAQKQKLNKTRR
jgi:hypothetical protein